ncbi:hypothetical protein GH714_007761 [Hevea brasiliensis]|uniref:BCNT-C domain-containing protein n=1 Tax=Hevea brasiliensis TaxID=3981 RepID=A0A6A6MD29_HEVBR|nr:hypothetical protein GH714_007761 [Hevea brasiliensis]
MEARVQAMWEQMNKGLGNKPVKPISNKRISSTMNTNSQKFNDNWMTYLGLAPKKAAYPGQGDQQNGGSGLQDGTSKDDKNWMAYLGLATKKSESSIPDASQKGSSVLQNATSDEAKKLAAAALSAVKDAAAAASGRGKVEISEVRDFAGQEIEVKKLVDAESKEAAEKARSLPPSAVDAVLEQIKKKPKLSVLDKTKKDWGEFKEENKLG